MALELEPEPDCVPLVAVAVVKPVDLEEPELEVPVGDEEEEDETLTSERRYQSGCRMRGSVYHQTPSEYIPTLWPACEQVSEYQLSASFRSLSSQESEIFFCSLSVLVTQASLRSAGFDRVDLSQWSVKLLLYSTPSAG